MAHQHPCIDFARRELQLRPASVSTAGRVRRASPAPAPQSALYLPLLALALCRDNTLCAGAARGRYGVRVSRTHLLHVHPSVGVMSTARVAALHESRSPALLAEAALPSQHVLTDQTRVADEG